jgi:hypothetical protein
MSPTKSNHREIDPINDPVGQKNFSGFIFYAFEEMASNKKSFFASAFRNTKDVHRGWKLTAAATSMAVVVRQR